MAAGRNCRAGVQMPRSRDAELIRSIGVRVRLARQAKNLSQEALANTLQLQPESLSRLENGARGLSLTQLSAIASVLGVKLGDLVDPEREFSEALRTAEADELQRRFDSLSNSARDAVLRIMRELSATQDQRPPTVP
jgi:transcriptional regulator with XRE-family HTH domain